MSRTPHTAPARLTPVVLLCHALLAALSTSCVKLPRRTPSAEAQVAAAAAPSPAAAQNVPPAVNINRATREELERLPGVGPGIAARIVEHRERYGPFRKVEHLIAVRGVSERRFAALRARVVVD